MPTSWTSPFIPPPLQTTHPLDRLAAAQRRASEDWINTETRVTDPETGAQKGRKPQEYALIPVGALASIAEVYGYGATKYTTYGDCTCASVASQPMPEACVDPVTTKTSSCGIQITRLDNGQMLINGISSTERDSAFTSEDAGTASGAGFATDATSESATLRAGTPNMATQHAPGCGALKVISEGKNNWRKGYAWSLSYSALQRHLNAFWGGEETDPESGLPHLAHAGFHILSLLTFSSGKQYAAKDDRA